MIDKNPVYELSIKKIKKFWMNQSKCDHKLINYLLNRKSEW